MFDPMSTPMVISCADVLLPVITKMINLSLNSGEFADDWKCGLINPTLKKPGLDLPNKNYKPVSNLQYVSKLTKKSFLMKFTITWFQMLFFLRSVSLQAIP